ncbi:hypothetical protein CH063_12715 [Colletotrichum higginsianum]|uniref:Uncharacterized protein n=1 Tax=Colletotrichum higginsianum (strain IMI 349063) TaxID=759273 RepID=H1VRH0_COLHI|nr:hypothetical protein CH063_12715 [Colletotrichum higginsianum]
MFVNQLSDVYFPSVLRHQKHGVRDKSAGGSVSLRIIPLDESAFFFPAALACTLPGLSHLSNELTAAYFGNEALYDICTFQSTESLDSPYLQRI